MKTQVNKLKKEQALGHKIIFFYLLVFGIIAIGTTNKNLCKNISQSPENNAVQLHNNNSNLQYASIIPFYSVDKEGNHNENYMVPLKAEFNSVYANGLETRKLNRMVTKNSHLIYEQMLAELANVEEPELLIDDVLSQLDFQVATFKTHQAIHFVQEQNAYLNEMYKEKNNKVWNEIERSHQLKEALMAENESKLDIESWMTDGNFWKLSVKENREIEQTLAEMYAQKNAEVFESVEMEMTIKSIGTVEREEPLLVENWMVDTYDNTTTQKVVKNEYLANMANAKSNEVEEMIVLLKKVKCCGIIEKEEPLTVEAWMTSERCWCPNKKQIKNAYGESFALLGGK